MTTTSRANAHTHTVSGKNTSSNASHTHEVNVEDPIAEAIAAHEAKYHAAPIPGPEPVPTPFPWANLQAAVNNPPADRVIDCGGRVFTELVTVSGAGNLRVKNAIIDAQNTRTGYADITAPNVSFENVRMIHAKHGGTFEMGQPGSLQIGARGFTGVNLVMTDAWYAGVRIWIGADGAILQDCDIAGGSVGVLSYRPTLAILGGAYHDNRDSKNPGNESGGMKLCESSRAVVEGVKAYNNVGPGIWGDVYNTGLLVRDSEAFDNTMAGIMDEISTGSKILNNKAYRNGKTGGNAYQSQTNIFISSSSYATVQGNLCAFGGAGDIAVVSQGFDSGRLKYAPHAGTVVTGNTLTTAPKFYTDWTPGGTPPTLAPNTVIPASDKSWDGMR